MKLIVKLCKQLRNWAGLTERFPLVFAGLIITCFILVVISPTVPLYVRFPVSLIGIFVIFLKAIQQCKDSCWCLVKFLVVGSFLFAVMVLDLLANITSQIADIIQYISFIISFTIFWIISVGVADEDAAEMACDIVNSFSTILLLAFNVFFTWCDQTGRLAPFESKAEIEIQEIGVIILPIVVAGYIAALFIKGTQYIKKKEAKTQKSMDEGAI